MWRPKTVSKWRQKIIVQSKKDLTQDQLRAKVQYLHDSSTEEQLSKINFTWTPKRTLPACPAIAIHRRGST